MSSSTLSSPSSSPIPIPERQHHRRRQPALLPHRLHSPTMTAMSSTSMSISPFQSCSPSSSPSSPPATATTSLRLKSSDLDSRPRTWSLRSNSNANTNTGSNAGGDSDEDDGSYSSSSSSSTVASPELRRPRLRPAKRDNGEDQATAAPSTMTTTFRLVRLPMPIQTKHHVTIDTPILSPPSPAALARRHKRCSSESLVHTSSASSTSVFC